MKSQLERAINLSANTGDKIIVVDQFNDRSSVLMSIDDYEELLNGQSKVKIGVENLTEEQLLDKINRDIVSWKDANKDKDFEPDALDFGEDWVDEEDDLNEAPAIVDEPVSLESDFNPIDEIKLVDSVEEAKSEDIKEEEIKPVEAAVEENTYYYQEPEKTEADAKEEQAGFTSIKDELKKSKAAWKIPEEVIQKAIEAEAEAEAEKV